MKVYLVVISHNETRRSWTRAVFSSMKKAEAYINSQDENMVFYNQEREVDISIQEHTVDERP